MAVSAKHYDPYRKTLFGRVRHWWGSFPRWMRWTGLACVLALIATGGVLAANRRMKSSQSTAVRAGWERFEKAAKEMDESELFAALDEVSAADPTDQRASDYRRALKSGEGSAADGALSTLLLIRHLRNNDLPAAAREARKRLEHEPNDWLARCTAAEAALKSDGLAAAKAELALLPNISRVPPSVLTLLYAHDLHTRTGADANQLRRFVNERVIDSLGSVAVEQHPPSAKVQRLRCYLLGFDTPPGEELGKRLASAVQPATRLADTALTELLKEDTTSTLVQLGLACDGLVVALHRLRKDGQITAAQFDGLSVEHEKRVERVWREVLSRKPKEPAAYLGLSRWYMRAGRRADARGIAADGLKECGDHVLLLAQYSGLLLRDADADDAANVTWAAAEREPRNVVYWLLAAEAAHAVPRRDRALIACQRVRALVPGHPRALWLESQILLDTGDSNGAIQLLRQLGEGAILSTTQLARVYSRALVEAGLGVTAPDLLTSAEAAGVKAGNPAVAAAVITGLSETNFDPTVSAATLSTADRLSDRWPADPTILSARAAALRQAAAEGTPPWDPIRTHPAVAALERALISHPDDLDVVSDLVWAKWKGEGAANRAWKAAEPLVRAHETSVALTGRQLTALGGAWLANGKPDQAVVVLVQAERIGPPTATASIHLARAYMELKKPTDARIALAAARGRRMSAQDQADHAAVSATLPREKP